MPFRVFRAPFWIAPVLAAGAIFVAPLHADTIAWAKWSSATAGTPGTASATIGSISVTYSGQNSGLLTSYPSWTPVSSFTGGVVGNAPPAANNSVQIEGGSPITETISFSTVVADPIFAVESLGAPGTPASFNFLPSETFSVVAGGPSSEYGGTALTVSGTDVLGREGSGVIQFNGDYSSITFTTPSSEYFYMFTVGEDATLTSQLPPGGGGGGGSVTPEPSSFLLMGTGLLAAAGLIRLRRREG